MIKTCVYSYWAKPFLEKNTYSNFERKNDLIISLKLSVEQSRKYFDKIVFYGDHEAISQVCEFIKFDKVYDDIEILNENNVPHYLFNAPKAIACSKMQEPFILLENDFYLWNIPSNSHIFESNLIIEDFKKPSKKYYRCIEAMKNHNLTVRPRWYKFAKSDFLIPKKGIYGGNNLKFISEHATEVVKLLLNNKNNEFFNEKKYQKSFLNSDVVYDNWYCGAKIQNNNIEPFVLRSSDISYTHLSMSEKSKEETILKLYKIANKNYSEFVEKLKNENDTFYDPVSDHDYFIEKENNIENVPCGKKKLSFVMALMNRSHQIEQTLIKNLEDNWEDRDDVEFVLMDVNSQDGFRKWIRSMDLTKYTESGFLRYFEVDSIDKWHASIGKNTAAHQAVGKIVVTLDCDNFTGYRGGRFLITEFEKNDYNCIVHQYDGNPQNGNFGRISLTKKKFNEIGGYDQSFLPMGYQDWDIIKRAEAVGCKYINLKDSEFNRAIEIDGKKELFMANTNDSHKAMGWVEMNRINKLKCHHNLYNKKYKANDGYYGIRSNVKRIYGEE
jgi:hypothetical protein